jgi:hypothetical protein
VATLRLNELLRRKCEEGVSAKAHEAKPSKARQEDGVVVGWLPPFSCDYSDLTDDTLQLSTGQPYEFFANPEKVSVKRSPVIVVVGLVGTAVCWDRARLLRKTLGC